MTCLFCPAPANSKEDVWPKWLLRRFETAGQVTVSSMRRGAPPSTWIQARPEMRVGAACATCNSEWMSRLEMLAKPVVLALVDGGQVRLDAAARTTIARWALKIAMVLERFVGRGSSEFYSESERLALREDLAVPLRTHVWIAKGQDVPGFYATAGDFTDHHAGGPEGFAGYVTSLAFGDVALQIRTLRTPAAFPAQVPVEVASTSGPWDKVALTVWPLDSAMVLWPPTIGLAGELGLEAFHLRWLSAPDP